MYTVIGDPFAEWVKARVIGGNTKIVQVQNLAIDMDPEVYAAFTNSTAVSSKYLSISSIILISTSILTILSLHIASKGVGVNLLKVGTKRRRTRQEILDDKEEARIKEEGMQGKLAQIDSLTQRCAELEQKAKGNEAADLILRDMISKGQAVMDENGNVTIP